MAVICQVRVYSGKGSSQVWTETDEGEGQRLDKGLVRPELGPIGFNDKGIEPQWKLDLTWCDVGRPDMTEGGKSDVVTSGQADLHYGTMHYAGVRLGMTP